MMTSPAQIVLHTDDNGQAWCLDTNREIRKFIDIEGLDWPRVSAYRMLLRPENYSLITSVYSDLQADGIPLLLGNPYRFDAKDKDAMLHSLATLDPSRDTPVDWHVADTCEFNTSLALGLRRKKPSSADTVYKQLSLRPFFDFCGAYDSHGVLNVLQEIGDPRWFIRVGDERNLGRLERYFNLHRAGSLLLGEDRDNDEDKRRLLVLVDLVRSLSEGSWVNNDAKSVPQQENALIFRCRRLLRYLWHIWTDELTGRQSFDPSRFFLTSIDEINFCKQFAAYK